MAVSFPASLPSGAARQVLRMRNVSARTETTFGFSVQIFEHTGERWEIELTMPPLTRAQAGPWLAFAAAQRGGSGTFVAGDPKGTRLGIGTGTPLINGAQAANLKTLATKGWTINITGILKAGDYLQIGSGATQRLHMVLQDASSSAGGLATFDIWPRLREAVIDNAAITIAMASAPVCKGVFRLDGASIQCDVSPAGLYTIAFAGVEAI